MHEFQNWSYQKFEKSCFLSFIGESASKKIPVHSAKILVLLCISGSVKILICNKIPMDAIRFFPNFDFLKKAIFFFTNFRPHIFYIILIRSIFIEIIITSFIITSDELRIGISSFEWMLLISEALENDIKCLYSNHICYLQQ